MAILSKLKEQDSPTTKCFDINQIMQILCLISALVASLSITVGLANAKNHLPKCPRSPLFEAENQNQNIYWNNCKGKVVLLDGRTIIGEFKNDKLSGWGSVIWTDGSNYDGEFKNGLRHGNGEFTDPVQGVKYKGQYRNGYPNGVGTTTWENGTKYIGEFKNGKYEGAGIMSLPDGRIHEGIFKNNKLAYLKKTKYSSKISILKKLFVTLPTESKKIIQSNLQKLGYYKSSIDGLYGKNTERALNKFNNQHLGGADITNVENVERLLKIALEFNITPEEDLNEKAPYETYKVASGTGFYVSDDGHIVTNYHVIEGCQDIKVHLKGNAIDTNLIAKDTRNDLALLKVDEKPKYSFALSDESPFPLQDIIVAGYPFGEKVSSPIKFTEGIISAIAGLGDDYSQVQIDAAIQPGNSGGPILDEFGNVIAVAVAKLSLQKILKDYGVVPENTNFGVKASAVRNLIEGNGINLKNPTKELISKRDLSQIANNGTVFLSCWMTPDQIEHIREKKVLFKELN